MTIHRASGRGGDPDGADEGGAERPPLGRAVGTALPDWAAAGFALHAWLDPAGFGVAAIPGFIALMLAEFILLMAGLLVTGVSEVERQDRARLGLWQLGIAAGLIAILLAACASMGTWWPLAGGLWLVLSRVSVLFLDPLPRARAERRARWLAAVGLAAFVASALLWAIATPPAMGFANLAAYSKPISGSGLLVEVPQFAVAWAFAYFVLAGMGKLLLRR